MGKGRNRRIQIMNALHDTRPLEIENRLANLLPIRTREHQFRLARAGDADFRIAVDVAIGMTGDGNRLLPSTHRRTNAADENRRAEDRAVEHSANRAVGRLPHLVQVVLRHALGVRSDGCALDRDAVLLRRVGAVNRHLITRFVAVRQAKIVILRLQIHERLNQQLLDVCPQDAGHFVAIHLHQRRFHLNLFHTNTLSLPFR